MVFEGFTTKYSKLNAVIKLIWNVVSGLTIYHAKGGHSDGVVLVHYASWFKLTTGPSCISCRRGGWQAQGRVPLQVGVEHGDGEGERGLV
jgi:hypothetical protein